MGGEIRIPGQDGFTLIELTLVVLIIAILAALAIPRYQDLTARAHNGSVLADLGQFCVTETAFLGDCQQYGRTNNVDAVAAHGNGSFLIGPSTSTAVIAGPTEFTPIGLSTGVHLVAHTRIPDGMHFSVMAKHISGTRIFGADNAFSGLYQRKGQPGQTLAGAGIALAASAADDFSGSGWNNL